MKLVIIGIQWPNFAKENVLVEIGSKKVLRCVDLGAEDAKPT